MTLANGTNPRHKEYHPDVVNRRPFRLQQEAVHVQPCKSRRGQVAVERGNRVGFQIRKKILDMSSTGRPRISRAMTVHYCWTRRFPVDWIGRL